MGNLAGFKREKRRIIKEVKMVGKIDIDKAKRERIIDEAGKLAKEKAVKYDGCATSTFEAICEAFKSEGIEFFTPEVQHIIAQGITGHQGGLAITGVGTCGAVSSAAFLISHVIGVTPEELAEDVNRNYAIAIPIVEYVVARFEEDYGAIDCLRLRYNRVQRAYDRLDPDAKMYEMIFGMYENEKCNACAAYCGADDEMPVARGARYAAEAICDLLGMEPEERKEVPPHFRGLTMTEITPRIQELIDELKRLGFGRPHEKISYRDYWTFKTKGKKGLEEKRIGRMSAPEQEK
jgi:hypothetical protein